jgi:hypothetical protein
MQEDVPRSFSRHSLTAGAIVAALIKSSISSSVLHRSSRIILGEYFSLPFPLPDTPLSRQFPEVVLGVAALSSCHGLS